MRLYSRSAILLTSNNKETFNIPLHTIHPTLRSISTTYDDNKKSYPALDIPTPETKPTGPKVSVSNMRSNLGHPIPDPNIILTPYMKACSTNFSTNTATIMQIHKWRHITKIYVDLYPRSRPLLISIYNQIWWIIFRQNPLKIKLYMVFQALFAQPLYAHPFYTLFYNL